MRFRFLTLIPDAGSLAKAARILEYLIICCYNDTITVDDSDEDFYMKLIADYSMPIAAALLLAVFFLSLPDLKTTPLPDGDKKRRVLTRADALIMALEQLPEGHPENDPMLIVEEEEAFIPPPEPETPPDENLPELSEAERTVLRSLLLGESPQDYLRQKGLMLSVVAESINEKCFDLFSDTVLLFDGDEPEVIEDYADELKGMLNL